MPKRDRRDHAEGPAATRPKSAPQNRHDHWSHSETSRQQDSGRYNAPFNAFSSTAVRSRDQSPPTDDSAGPNKVILRSNSEIRRNAHHRSDLTSWKHLTVPTMATAQLPEWARPSQPNLVLPSSHTPDTQFAPASLTQPSTTAPPLSILFRQNGDQIVHVHGEPPESEKQWYLDVIRSVCPNMMSNIPNPFQLPVPQQHRRQRAIGDAASSASNAAVPVLQLPFPAQSLSESTDAEQPGSFVTPLHTTPYAIQVGHDGMTVIGNDINALKIRFLTDRETKHVKLPKSSTWVPWANMSLIECKHHQSHESGMQNIWCPSPYCWLISEQLIHACKQKSNKADVWLRLWHFLDTMKDEANKATNRLASAHEMNLKLTIHHDLVDAHLRQQIKAKLADGFNASSCATQMQMLEHILSNWNGWQDHVHIILPQMDEKNNTPVLMVFYQWKQPIRSYVSKNEPIPVIQTIPWGHATNMDSGIQIVNSGGLRPASIEDESGNVYHWSPSFYCRVNGDLVDNQIDHTNYITLARQTIFHCRKRTANTQRPMTFHGIAHARQRHLTVTSGGTAAEYSASLFFDVVHGHAHRWLIKCHIATLLGFAV